MGLLKEKDENLLGDDYREGITVVLSIKMNNVQFEGQTKTKLGNSEAKVACDAITTEQLTAFFKKNKGVAEIILKKALLAAKVREAARQIGYMPNSAARALKTNRTYNLGVLFVDEAQSGLTHEFFAAVLDSFKRHAEGRGYDITFINHNIGHGHSSYLEHCRYRGVDGVIAACIKFDDPEVIELAYSNLPIVTVDHVFNNRAAVLSDNTEGVHRLVDQLAALGHERIAYIHGENHSAVTQKRLVGFYRACAAHGITVPDAYIVPSTYRDAKSCAAATRQLLALPQRPTAILFPDDFSAIGGIQTIREEGLLIPRDISVAGYDGNLISQIMSPQLTTYRQDTEALGRAAAELLIEQIESPRTALPEQKLISGSLLKGQSVDVPNP